MESIYAWREFIEGTVCGEQEEWRRGAGEGNGGVNIAKVQSWNMGSENVMMKSIIFCANNKINNNNNNFLKT